VCIPARRSETCKEIDVSQVAPEITKANPIWGTGRRKSAVARVRLLLGSGKLLINDREVDEYFTEEKDRASARSPLVAAKQMTTYDIFVRVQGGGSTGQADSVKLGIARALKKADTSLEAALRSGGFMTRDPRMKERKKYGQRGARRRFQFSKR
jgi:small subunit ribosomal protein S9